MASPDAPQGAGDDAGPGHAHAHVVPMYAQLLEAVLSDDVDPATQVRSPGPLAELVRARQTMEKHAAHVDAGWALQAVADQLAYDAALIRLARKRGIPAEPGSFEIPERGRSVLERQLVAKGVNLPGPLIGPQQRATGDG